MASRRSKRDFEQVVEHLRETLTYDIVAKAFRCRFGKELDEAEYEEFAEEISQ